MLSQFQNTKTDDPDTAKAIPSNFGAPDGPGISNKESILQDVDKAVSEGRPPDLEVLLADHLCYTGNSFMKAAHLTLLRYGHIAVRYTTKVWASCVYFLKCLNSHTSFRSMVSLDISFALLFYRRMVLSKL